MNHFPVKQTFELGKFISTVGKSIIRRGLFLSGLTPIAFKSGPSLKKMSIDSYNCCGIFYNAAAAIPTMQVQQSYFYKATVSDFI